MLAYSLRELCGTPRIGLFAQDTEFFAAEATYHIGLPCQREQDFAKSMEDLIPLGMTVCVVNTLEVVDVGEDQTKLFAVALRRLKSLMHLFEESAFVQAT